MLGTSTLFMGIKMILLVDWPVGLMFRDPDCYARGRGFDSQPGQIFECNLSIHICMYLKHI